MKLIGLVFLALVSSTSFAKAKKKPAPIIYQFPAINWSRVESLQASGKKVVEHLAMQCDDDYYDMVEVRFKFEPGTGLHTGDCRIKDSGKSHIDGLDWWHIEGPDENCTIEVERTLNNGTELKVTYELSSSC